MTNLTSRWTASTSFTSVTPAVSEEFERLHTVRYKKYGPPFSTSTMMAPMFRVSPWGVRSSPGPWFSQMLEPKIQNLIILHCHYLVLPGFTAGTSDIRTCYFCLNLRSKKILSRYWRFLLWNQVKLSNASALLSNFGSLAPTFVKIRVWGYP